jgi:hypothetical protein
MAIESIRMEDDIKRPDPSIRPPRWAEALLRIVLTPDKAETESGDLLEAYRDSIRPLRGGWRANLWFVRQVAGYIVRASVMGLRNWILAGLTLCVVTIAFSALRYPGPPAVRHDARNLGAICLGLVFYGWVAVRRTRPVTPEDASVLRLGTKWGVAIGALWIAGHICGNLVVPHGLGAQAAIVFGLVAFALPFVAGAHAARKIGRFRAGMRVGFWSGLISGLMAFLSAAVIGYILAFIPGLPGAEIRSTDHIYTAAEYQRVNVMDALGGALAHLFLIGGVFGVVGGTVGGCAGILLARTERGANVSDRT